jgi:hypothetical protein
MTSTSGERDTNAQSKNSRWHPATDEELQAARDVLEYAHPDAYTHIHRLRNGGFRVTLEFDTSKSTKRYNLYDDLP